MPLGAAQSIELQLVATGDAPATLILRSSAWVGGSAPLMENIPLDTRNCGRCEQELFLSRMNLNRTRTKELSLD